MSISRFHVCVPKCYRCVHDNDRTWWYLRISRLPKESQISCNLLLTKRIPPLSKSVRKAIMNAYYPELLISSINLSEPDQDCLIRPYLGRRHRLVEECSFQAFILRNYPHHIDHIEELELDGILYSRIMAKTLADLYWRMRATWYLCSSPQEKDSANSTIKSQIVGEHRLDPRF